MANRGFFQRRGTTTDLIGRNGQQTTGLPNGTQESSAFNMFKVEGHDGNSYPVPIASPLTLIQPRDDIADKSSFQINQPFGFINVNQPRTFNISGGSSVTTYYKMRGYYAIGAVYETYVVSGAPSSNPPSGHTLTDVSIISIWQV